MRKIIALLCAAVLTLSLCGCRRVENKELSVVAVNFPAYDFARAVLCDMGEVSMLLPPGAENHGFEPSPADMRAIENADVFIYTGGESDNWIEKILASSKNDNRKVINMCSVSEPLCEDEHEHGHGHDHEHEHIDEHVWLSPVNAVLIIKAIRDALTEADSKNSDYYSKNAENYCSEIMLEAQATKKVIDAAPHRTLIVADRFPLKYLCDYYALSYLAAFDACDTFADADAKTVASLISAVEEKGLSHIFKIESGSGNLAKTVCEETGAESLTIYSMHTVSSDDFSAGVTYVDIMKRNKEALERGLN